MNYIFTDGEQCINLRTFEPTLPMKMYKNRMRRLTHLIYFIWERMCVVGLRTDQGPNRAAKVKLHVSVAITFSFSPYYTSCFTQYLKMNCP